MMNAKAEKAALRKSMLSKRSAASNQELEQQAMQICKLLWPLIQSKKVAVLHSYLPMGNEVNIYPILQRALDEHIQIVAPKTLKAGRLSHLVLDDLNDLASGLFGTLHPRSHQSFSGTIDMILVPGLAFDKQGGRLGYGGGYYDAFLAQEPEALKVGIGYAFQMVEKVAMERHDISLDFVIHPHKVTKCLYP